MKNITLASYLEKNPESKRLNKRFARALKIYIHAAKDINHAADDLAHASEDCTFALQSAAQIVEEHRDLLEEWALPVEEEAVTAIEPDKKGGEAGFDDEEECNCEGCDEEECNCEECDPCEEVGSHLRHAAKDIADALRDAESAIDCLNKADDLLIDIMSIAEEDGFHIDESEAKGYLIQKAKDSAAAKASDAEKS